MLSKIGRMTMTVLAVAGLIFGATACSSGTSKADQEVAISELLGRGFDTAQFDADVAARNGEEGYARYSASTGNCSVDVQRTADGSMFYERGDIYRLNLENFLDEPVVLALQAPFLNTYGEAMGAC